MTDPTPRKRAPRKTAPSKIADVEIADIPVPQPKNQSAFAGFEFVPEPEPNRTIDRDDAFWQDVKNVLEMAPGRWARVKTFDKINAAPQKSANINGNRNKLFPSDKFEARYTKNLDAGTSDLFLCFRD